MSRLLQAVVLVLLGTTAVRLVLTAEHLRLVKPSLGPFLLVAGALIALLGLLACWYDSSSDASADDHAHDDGHGHDHGHGGPRVGLALLLPVAVLLAVAPSPLGSFAAERARARVPVEPVAQADGLPLPPVGATGYRETTLSDYTARAHWGTVPSYDGEPVSLTGFVTPRAEGGWYLTRMTLACCAADGAPVKVLVRDGGPAPERDSWVRVEGTGVGETSEQTKAEDALGEVVAQRVTPVEEPEQPYE